VALRPPLGKTPDELLHEGPEASLGAALTRDLAWRAAITGGAATAAWLLARVLGGRERAGTVALVTLTGTQLLQTLFLGSRSLSVLATSAGSMAALLAIVQTPLVSRFFGCRPLGPIGLLQAAGASLAGAGAALVLPRFRRARGGPRE
jgi:cation-transporting ATPase I